MAEAPRPESVRQPLLDACAGGSAWAAAADGAAAAEAGAPEGGEADARALLAAHPSDLLRGG